MNHLAQIQIEFVKQARQWKDMSLEDQKSYLKRHPKSKQRITARPETVKSKEPKFKKGDIVAEIDKDKVITYWLITGYHSGNPNRSGPGPLGGPTMARYKARFINGVNSNGKLRVGDKTWELGQDYIDKDSKKHTKSKFVKKLISGKLEPGSSGLTINPKYLEKKDIDIDELKDKVRTKFKRVRVNIDDRY